MSSPWRSPSEGAKPRSFKEIQEEQATAEDKEDSGDVSIADPSEDMSDYELALALQQSEELYRNSCCSPSMVDGTLTIPDNVTAVDVSNDELLARYLQEMENSERQRQTRTAKVDTNAKIQVVPPSAVTSPPPRTTAPISSSWKEATRLAMKLETANNDNVKSYYKHDKLLQGLANAEGLTELEGVGDLSGIMVDNCVANSIKVFVAKHEERNYKKKDRDRGKDKKMDTGTNEKAKENG